MHCGCVLVRDKQILSTGYNGSIPGDKHCEDDGCLIVDNHCVRTIHAEMNAILQCSSHGISTQGATAYITNMPCTNCSKALITAGIKEVVIFSDYHDTLAEKFFDIATVNIKRLKIPSKDIDYNLESFASAQKFK
jgi:dCMP deaminase